MKVDTTKNLIPFTELTEEEHKALSSKGGYARAKNIARRKTLKEELLLLLETGDNQENISVALIQKAMKGDTKAFEVIRDTVGEKPTDKVEVKDTTPKWFKKGDE